MFSTYRAAPDYETAIRNKIGGIAAQQNQQQQISWQQPKFISDMVPAPQPQQQQQPHGYSLHEDHFHNIQQQQTPQQPNQGKSKNSGYTVTATVT